ncbi:unnamed protein product, partial [Gordionus sp. m RMFG-2023]
LKRIKKEALNRNKNGDTMKSIVPKTKRLYEYEERHLDQNISEDKYDTKNEDNNNNVKSNKKIDAIYNDNIILNDYADKDGRDNYSGISCNHKNNNEQNEMINTEKILNDSCLLNKITITDVTSNKLTVTIMEAPINTFKQYLQ